MISAMTQQAKKGEGTRKCHRNLLADSRQQHKTENADRKHTNVERRHEGDTSKTEHRQKRMVLSQETKTVSFSS